MHVGSTSDNDALRIRRLRSIDVQIRFKWASSVVQWHGTVKRSGLRHQRSIAWVTAFASIQFCTTYKTQQKPTETLPDAVMDTKMTVVVLIAVCALALALLGASSYSAYRAEQNHPPIGEFVDANGLSLHYTDSRTGSRSESDAQTLVLLHGASTSLLDFQRSLLPALTDHYRVITFDRPGMGYSEASHRWMTPLEQAEHILAALAVMGVNRAVWVGHSWAGAVVLSAMQDHPEHIEAGVLLAGATHPWEGGVKWDSTLANVPIVGSMMARLIVPLAGRLVIEDAVAGVFTPEEVPDGYVQETGVHLSIRPEAFLNNAADLYHLSDWLEQRVEQYPALTPPLLMITGSGDEVVPAWNHAERMAKALPDATWLSLDGAGHALHHTRTDTVASHILEFTNTLK